MARAIKKIIRAVLASGSNKTAPQITPVRISCGRTPSLNFLISKFSIDNTRANIKIRAYLASSEG